MSESTDDQSSSAKAEVSNPALAAMASQTFDRLISHSRFLAVMLDMKDSLLPLPAAAQKLKLHSPFASILPLVDSRPLPQVHNFRLDKICIRLGLGICPIPHVAHLHYLQIACGT